MKLGEGLRKDLAARGLTSSSYANQHDSMSHHHGLEELDDLLDVFRRNLEFPEAELVLNGHLQLTIVDEGDIHTREQIVDDTFE